MMRVGACDGWRGLAYPQPAGQPSTILLVERG